MYELCAGVVVWRFFGSILFECEAGLWYSRYLEACLFLHLFGFPCLVGLGGYRVSMGVAVFLAFGGRGVVWLRHGWSELVVVVVGGLVLECDREAGAADLLSMTKGTCVFVVFTLIGGFVWRCLCGFLWCGTFVCEKYVVSRRSGLMCVGGTQSSFVLYESYVFVRR